MNENEARGYLSLALLCDYDETEYQDALAIATACGVEVGSEAFGVIVRALAEAFVRGYDVCEKAYGGDEEETPEFIFSSLEEVVDGICDDWKSAVTLGSTYLLKEDAIVESAWDFEDKDSILSLTVYDPDCARDIRESIINDHLLPAIPQAGVTYRGETNDSAWCIIVVHESV